MTRIPSSLDHGSPEPEDLFSAEPMKRVVEEAFVRRQLDLAYASTVRILEFGRNGKGHSVEGDLRRIQSPVFARLARIIEKSVPDDADFGPFGKR